MSEIKTIENNIDSFIWKIPQYSQQRKNEENKQKLLLIMAQCIRILEDPISKVTPVYANEQYYFRTFQSIFQDLLKLPATDETVGFFYDFVLSFINFNADKLRYEKNQYNNDEYKKILSDYDKIFEKQENYFNEKLIEDEEPTDEYIEYLLNQPKELDLIFKTNEEFEKYFMDGE